MDGQLFWEVIGKYNSQTIVLQIILFIMLAVALVLSWKGKITWAAKAALGIVHLFIGIIFFGVYGVEPIQKYFALPLYLCCGVLFIVESIINKNDVLEKANRCQIFLLILYISYPIISFALGNRFPMITTYIMPCPVVCLGITVFSRYKKKNIFLLILLTVWGLTGIKAFFANAYEDIILLICGIYGIWLIIKEIQRRKGL